MGVQISVAAKTRLAKVQMGKKCGNNVVYSRLYLKLRGFATISLLLHRRKKIVRNNIAAVYLCCLRCESACDLDDKNYPQDFIYLSYI